MEVFFVLGEALVPLAGYLAGSWRATILWLMVPSLIPLLYWPLFPESPREEIQSWVHLHHQGFHFN